MSASTRTGSNLHENERLLVGLFRDKDNAEKAYNDLRDMGYAPDEINVVMTNDTRKRYYSDKDKNSNSEMRNKALEGTGAGAAIGGVAGGIAGAIAAVGTNLLIPGLGLVVLGPLAAGLAGAGAGGITGGIIGALIGAGIPEENAKMYNEALENGSILLSVKPHNGKDVEKLTRKWTSYQADVNY